MRIASKKLGMRLTQSGHAALFEKRLILSSATNIRYFAPEKFPSPPAPCELGSTLRATMEMSTHDAQPGIGRGRSAITAHA
jgi:hypothetical protein